MKVEKVNEKNGKKRGGITVLKNKRNESDKREKKERGTS